MTRILAAACAMYLAFGAVQPAGAGPVKHWGTFPDREVRAVALRGAEMGANPDLGVVPGRDGYVYLVGVHGLYRVLDASGRYKKILTPAVCDAGGIGDASTWVPSIACVRGGRLVRERAGGVLERIDIPRPPWRDADNLYSSDYDAVTGVFPGTFGRAWFAYGYAHGAGHAALLHVPGVVIVRQIAALGDDVYLADDRCRVAHVRASGVVWIEDFHCGISVALRRTPERIWLLFGNELVAVDRRGRRQRWSLPILPREIATDHRGTAYVLGTDAAHHVAIATIDPAGRVNARTLPMAAADSIFVDQRDRLWIGISFWRAFAVVAPKGAWG